MLLGDIERAFSGFDAQVLPGAGQQSPLLAGDGGGARRQVAPGDQRQIARCLDDRADLVAARFLAGVFAVADAFRIGRGDGAQRQIVAGVDAGGAARHPRRRWRIVDQIRRKQTDVAIRLKLQRAAGVVHVEAGDAVDIRSPRCAARRALDPDIAPGEEVEALIRVERAAEVLDVPAGGQPDFFASDSPAKVSSSGMA